MNEEIKKSFEQLGFVNLLSLQGKFYKEIASVCQFQYLDYVITLSSNPADKEHPITIDKKHYVTKSTNGFPDVAAAFNYIHESRMKELLELLPTRFKEHLEYMVNNKLFYGFSTDSEVIISKDDLVKLKEMFLNRMRLYVYYCEEHKVYFYCNNDFLMDDKLMSLSGKIGVVQLLQSLNFKIAMVAGELNDLEMSYFRSYRLLDNIQDFCKLVYDVTAFTAHDL